MAGPQLQIVNFKKGTWIMVEGKRDADAFFIIRSGNVRLVKETEIVEEQGSNVLKPGDFFGVISCMSGHPRIESAISLSDVSLIMVKKNQFNLLIQKNAPIALKIIRSFSQKLRHFDDAVAKLTFKKSVEADPKELYNIGLYYLNAKNNNLAVYAFYKFLKLNQDGDQQVITKAKKHFQGLKRYAKEALNADMQNEGFTRTFKHNTFVFCEHEPGNELYIIQAGKVKITKIVEDSEVMLAVLNPGDIFGEMAILENKPRSANAIAEGNVTMFAVNRENFQGMVTKQPQLATKLITLLAERIWLIYRQLANILIKDPVGRLYDTLLTQVLKHKIEPKKAVKHIFDFGISDLLKMTGLDPVTDRQYADLLLKTGKFKLAEDKKIQCNDLEEIQKQVNYYKKKEAMERKREQKKKYGLH